MSNETAPSPNASTPAKDAPAPFSGVVGSDSDTRPADFILRSRDGVDFHVRKAILAAVSDFFDGLFTLPTSNPNDYGDISRDGKAVLVLPESAKVLYALLWMAYPRRSWAKNPLEETDMDGIVRVLTAANKYQFLVVERLVVKMLDAPALLDAHPYRVFAIAKLRALPALARAAALRTLRSPASPPPLAFPEMELLPWSTGQKMHDFHRQCGTAACEMTKKTAIWILSKKPQFRLHYSDEPLRLFVWWEINLHTYGCTARPSERGECLPAQWFQNHIKSLASRLRASPAATTVAVEALRIGPAGAHHV
ncbi:BTB domain-containing protein [Mycena venus]|uniref:BTB domain-containing protein n=1 Tax=Mycena venus TaxID=2733690 RepID=A0A8H6Z290_9AGAR|nr:BTB domain-containing protein [Mycena venus]